MPIPLNSYTIFCHIFTLANHDTTECPMMDTRLPHNDINLGIGNELFPSNWEECGKLCNEEPLCKFWTHYGSTGRCWLKVANSGATIENGNISGNKNCPLPTGAEIKFMFSKKATKINLLKVAFIQKGLMHLSFLQTDKPA